MNAQLVCRIVRHRDDLGHLLNALNLVGEGVEIGVLIGENSEMLLSTWKGRMLHLVDPWDDYGQTQLDCRTTKEGYNERLLLTQIRMEPFAERCTIHRNISSDAVSQFADNSLDFVYIDGNHRYNYVLQDLREWYPKVVPGGLIACHDYENYEVSMVGTRQVKYALDKFMTEHNIVLHITKDIPQTAFFIKE